MSRPIVAVALAMALVITPVAVAAQTAKMPRVGVLTHAEAPSLAGLRQGLRELGWEDGRNVIVEARFAGTRNERFDELARELVRLNVDVLATVSSQSVRAAKHATGTIPIVMFMVSHPVEAGFVASLARPGGNVTGVSGQLGDLAGKTLALLREAAPGVRRVAVLWDPDNLGSALGHKQTEADATAMGMHVISVPIRPSDDFESTLAALTRERPDALLVHPIAAVAAKARAIVDYAVKHRLPNISGSRSFVEAGFLMGYGPSNFEMGRRAARYVDKLLKGARPADLPVEQPTKFDLVISAKTARAIGLTIPPALLLRADHVVE
jgi:putative ABC transport system substrate-binding protein